MSSFISPTMQCLLINGISERALLSKHQIDLGALNRSSRFQSAVIRPVFHDRITPRFRQPEGPSSPDAYSYADKPETSCRRAAFTDHGRTLGSVAGGLKELLSVMDAGTVVWYRFLVAWLVILVWLQPEESSGFFRASVRVRWMMFIAALGLCGNYYFFPCHSTLSMPRQARQ